MTEREVAERINNATPEEIARIMEQLPTDTLEFAVRFESLAHGGLSPFHASRPEDDFEGMEPDFDDDEGSCPLCGAAQDDECDEDCPSWTDED